MTLLALFEMRKWISSDSFNQLETCADEIGRMLHGLIKAINPL
jgi:hypothetical protein